MVIPFDQLLNEANPEINITKMSTKDIQTVLRKDYPDDTVIDSKNIKMEKDKYKYYIVYYDDNEGVYGVTTVFVWAKDDSSVKADYAGQPIRDDFESKADAIKFMKKQK